MIYKPANTNRILILILFATLAFDLIGRYGADQQVISVDLASTTLENTTADGAYAEGGRKLKNGVDSTDKEGRTELRYKKANGVTVIVEARAVRGPRTDARTRPTEPTLKSCKDLDSVKKITCESDNARLERDYKAELDKYNSSRSSENEKITLEFTSRAETEGQATCLECQTTEIVETTTASVKTAADFAIQLRKFAEPAVKKVGDAGVKTQKLAKDIENCLKDEDGKALKVVAELECRRARLDGLDETKEQRLEFGKLHKAARQCLARAGVEEREECVSFLDSLSEDRDIPTDLRGVARVMKVSADYESKILDISTRMAIVGNDPQARMYGLQQLQQLQQEMQREIGTASASVYGRQTAISQELAFWSNSLGQSLRAAASAPQGYLDSHGYWGRDRLDFDINGRARLSRGGPNDPLVNTSSQFAGLGTSNERFINQEIEKIRQSTQLQNNPFGASGSQYSPGIGQPVGQVQPRQNLPGANQPVGYQPNGINTTQNPGTVPGALNTRSRL